MKCRGSAIAVVTGLASIAALTILGSPLHEQPVGPPMSPQTADETGHATVDVRSPAAAPIDRGDPPGRAAPPLATAEPATVAAPLPASPTVAAADVPPATSPQPSDTVGIDEMQTIAAPAQEYVLDIQAIDLHERVVAGGQDEIDQGYVTAVDWSSRGFPTSCRPDDGCTVWLAGHRSTHEAVFARLPEITTGSLIEIHFDGETFAYTVTDVLTVPAVSPPSVIRGDLVLQTSAPGGQRILIYAATTSTP